MLSTIHNSLGVYVSVPFCRAKCSYCNFASGVFGAERMQAYVDRLLEDIGSARSDAAKTGSELPAIADSIYFGGGTPSLLCASNLQQIINGINEQFAPSSDTEMTLECAPGQISDELMKGLPQIGFNRVSMGVQSFVDRESRAVGRMHTRAIALADMARLRSAGIENINVDLIAGLPHQTPESWRISVDAAIASGVPHVSVYMLDVDEDSRLGREMLAGGNRYGAAGVPDEQSIAAMYAEACERLNAAGIRQYEISNFARRGCESRHNLKYWNRQPYIGFGLDAHSFLPRPDGGAVRLGVIDQLDAYLGRTEPGSVTQVSTVQAIEETWFLGLRLNEGVSLSAMEQQIGPAALAEFEPVLNECQREGLLEAHGNFVRLTNRGRLFANEVFERFLSVVPEKIIEQETALA